MKKQGFTLIELMVVIVIMGILAAVAVPKLFSMIAKSKASEVGPAAGTYVHMQDTYYSENSDVGTASDIGYTAPPNNVFTYTVSAKGVFSAKNNNPLDNCAKNGEWKVESAVNSTSKVLTHTATVTGANCEALTPNFKRIGTSGT